MTDKLTRTINVTAFMLALYVLAYFALARPGVTVTIGGRWASWPDYRGLPEIAFRPLHDWDRTFLRPSRWEGANPPWTLQQLRAFDAFLKRNPDLSVSTHY